MRRLRRIKILATLGPASSDLAMIRPLFEAGADLFRINMSHTPHDKMRELVATIRNVESSYGRPIGILVDLQGPKLRLRSLAGRAGRPPNGPEFYPRSRQGSRRYPPRAAAASGNSCSAPPRSCALAR